MLTALRKIDAYTERANGDRRDSAGREQEEGAHVVKDDEVSKRERGWKNTLGELMSMLKDTRRENEALRQKLESIDQFLVRKRTLDSVGSFLIDKKGLDSVGSFLLKKRS